MKAKILKPAWASAVQLELFPEDNKPKPPAANVIEFTKRIRYVTMRMPEELEMEVRRRAQDFKWTRSHYCLRVVAEHCGADQALLGKSSWRAA